MNSTGAADDPFRDRAGEVPPYGVESPQRAGGPVRRIALAYVGAVATACDVANERFKRFVDRGERVRAEWEEKADDLRQQNAGARSRAQDFARTGMNVFLDNLNVPNKADVDTINVKLNILTRKIDNLQTQQSFAESAAEDRPETSPGTAPEADTGL